MILLKEERQAMKQYQLAFKNYIAAQLALFSQFSPIGNGVLTEESMAVVDSTLTQLRAEEANLMRIAGKRNLYIGDAVHD